MRIVLIALGALIVLGGGAAGAYFYFMKPAEASAVDKLDDHDDHAAKKDDGHDDKYLEYIEMDPLILPIIDQNGVSQTISIVIVLELAGSAAKIKAEGITPRLKDAFIQDMYGTLNKHSATQGGVLRVGYLKKRLNKISEEVLGKDQVNDVLLQVVQQRPI